MCVGFVMCSPVQCTLLATHVVLKLILVPLVPVKRVPNTTKMLTLAETNEHRQCL